MSDRDTRISFTDEHYIALGKMLVAFQSLEHAITSGLSKLIHPESLCKGYGFSFYLINELSFASRLRCLETFLDLYPAEHFIPRGVRYERVKKEEYTELLEELVKAIGLAKKAEERRNQLVHSYWLPDIGGEGTVCRMKIKAKPKKKAIQLENVSVAAITAVEKDLSRATAVISKSLSHLLIFLLDKKGQR